jgi:sugar-specific transcriptional regulator TrmB
MKIDESLTEQTIDQLLVRFGLDSQEREVYKLLVKRGWSTALQLSRNIEIKRATLYRVLERLLEKGLIEVEVDENTTHYNAATVTNFESMVMSAEEKARLMRTDLEKLRNQLSFLSMMGTDETKVRFFRGKRGLQQMEWRKCEKSNAEVLIFGSAQWHEVLGDEFAEKIRSEMVLKNIHVRELLNPTAISKKERDDMAKGIFTWTRNFLYATKHYEYRLVEEKYLKMTQDIYLVGDDTIHFHGYRESDTMGIEIISSEYTAMMRQMFELLWEKAR